jgi:hypothetical protein
MEAAAGGASRRRSRPRSLTPPASQDDRLEELRVRRLGDDFVALAERSMWRAIAALAAAELPDADLGEPPSPVSPWQGAHLQDLIEGLLLGAGSLRREEGVLSAVAGREGDDAAVYGRLRVNLPVIFARLEQRAFAEFGGVRIRLRANTRIVLHRPRKPVKLDEAREILDARVSAIVKQAREFQPAADEAALLYIYPGPADAAAAIPNGDDGLWICAEQRLRVERELPGWTSDARGRPRRIAQEDAEAGVDGAPVHTRWGGVGMCERTAAKLYGS